MQMLIALSLVILSLYFDSRIVMAWSEPEPMVAYGK
jgi:hypothetical protein